MASCCFDAFCHLYYLISHYACDFNIWPTIVIFHGWMVRELREALLLISTLIVLGCLNILEWIRLSLVLRILGKSWYAAETGYWNQVSTNKQNKSEEKQRKFLSNWKNCIIIIYRSIVIISGNINYQLLKILMELQLFQAYWFNEIHNNFKHMCTNFKLLNFRSEVLVIKCCFTKKCLFDLP